jgi:hypothetical protein
MHIPDQKRRKWNPKSRELIHVTYSEETNTYHLLDPVTAKIFKATNAFFEDHKSNSDLQEEKSSEKDNDYVQVMAGESQQEEKSSEEDNDNAQVMVGEPLQEEKSSDEDNAQEDYTLKDRRYPQTEREDRSSFLTWCSI